MREVKLPSGSVLKVSPAPFEDAKALFQAMAAEMKGVELSSSREITDMLKDLFFIGFSSKYIERCLEKCMERCLYNGVRINADTFEPIDARQDYLTVMAEVATENLGPFLKSLFAKFREVLTTIEDSQK